MIVTTTIFAVLYMLFNELEDECVRGNFTHPYLDSRQSWKNKWKTPLVDYKPKWYHFGIKHLWEERFPFSTTLFVFLTDGEHLFQWLKNLMLALAFGMFGIEYFISFYIGIFLLGLVKEKFLRKFLS